jgi:hypothetical protein
MRMRAAFGVAVVALVLLVGCAPEPAGSEGSPEPGGPSVEPTTTPTEEPRPTVREFRMPERCADILTPATADRFAAEGRDLLGGPDGLYGEEYFSEPTPEERLGGITCVWGDESDAASTVIVSVAPISAATRSGVVTQLISSGLIESQIEGAISYARIGDEVSALAELHVIRNDSWISVLEAVGGETRFQHATELVDEVTARVYVEG